eukprot:TRINITY_DN59491_c0_g1_i1.p1 TRINITY_DN59491_c0_g1~~TRINITY_DN59491_c0_g1_i1.p1  ORF type:complete len:177 (+),score=62.57 TRINITY_DN59491_c0_g1_i1:93-623(+)
MGVSKKGRVKKRGDAQGASKDVTMGDAGKVKRKINKSKRKQATKMQTQQRPESKKERRKRIALAALAGARVPGSSAAETAEQLRARHAEERKQTKAKVALLKKERGKLPKKGGKDQRQSAAQQIRALIEEMEVRQVAELRAAGLDAPSAAAAGAKAAKVSASRRGKDAAPDAMSDV